MRADVILSDVTANSDARLVNRVSDPSEAMHTSSDNMTSNQSFPGCLATFSVPRETLIIYVIENFARARR